MAIEIERKFLVVGETWRDQVQSSTHIMQGYIAHTPEVTVRVRVKGDQGFLTIKGASRGIGRHEFEFPIPRAEAEEMLRELAVMPPIDKVRHHIPIGKHVWELDVFAGENAGLVMAEIELTDHGEDFVLPDWAGQEVSDDQRYFNVNLARTPYRQW